jgi:hypothetical protein
MEGGRPFFEFGKGKESHLLPTVGELKRFSF